MFGLDLIGGAKELIRALAPAFIRYLMSKSHFLSSYITPNEQSQVNSHGTTVMANLKAPLTVSDSATGSTNK